MLYLIGTGLYDHNDLTLRAKQAINSCETIYLEYYTSLLSVDAETLSKELGKPVVVCNREFVEQKYETMFAEAKGKNVALLVIGDVFAATTHTTLFLEAKKENIDVQVIHNATVLTAVGDIGLELYKFGKTTSMTYFSDKYKPHNAYDILKENQSVGAHTLMLLDIDAENKRYMSIAECITQLFAIEQERSENIVSENTIAVGCARLGTPTQVIKCGTLTELSTFDFGGPLHCLVFPGKLHFIEEEALELWRQ